MRYKQVEVPTEQLASQASNGMLLVTSILGIIIGVMLVIIGRKGQQMWMWVWGLGLILVSVYLGISIEYGIRLFTYF